MELRDELGRFAGRTELWDLWLDALIGNALSFHQLPAGVQPRIEVRCAGAGDGWMLAGRG